MVKVIASVFWLKSSQVICHSLSIEPIAVLGEPIETIKSDDGRVDVYEYDGHCGGLFWILPIPYPLPVFFGTDQMLIVVYGPEGSFLNAQVRKGDIDAQYAMYFLDGEVPQGVRTSWVCLAAQNGHPQAQVDMGRRSWYGIQDYDVNHVRGFMWFSLSARSGHVRGENEVAERKPLLTAQELSEAERLVAEWEPNPAECETIGVQTEN